MINDSHLEKLIKKPKKIQDLNFEFISEILEKAKNLFEQENLLLNVNISTEMGEIFVIGDIHGNLSSLLEVLKKVEEEKPEKVIFLGDIVDRGNNQIECLIIVLSLKILEPDKYILLKGNHETLQMNQYYGFYDVFQSKYGNNGKFSQILGLYERLPICTIVDNKILCVHGGIPEEKSILSKLKGLKRNEIKKSDEEIIEQGIYQMIWNDPKEGLQGFMDSFRGPGIKFYGRDVFEEFLKVNNLELMIRAHECFPEGYKWFFQYKLLSIFTSANYRGLISPNPATYAVIESQNVQAKIL